jgi:hypothetical protein
MPPPIITPPQTTLMPIVIVDKTGQPKQPGK